MEFIGRHKIQKVFLSVFLCILSVGLFSRTCPAAEDKAIDSTKRQPNDPNAVSVPTVLPYDPNQVATETRKNDPNTVPVSTVLSDDPNQVTPETRKNGPNTVSFPTNIPDDPNAVAANDDGDDMFSPRFFTLVEIYQLYETIFNPDFITEDGLVRYSELRRKRSDLLKVARKLDDLNPAVLMSLSKDEKIAFWINTYNVCMLKLIIDEYPIKPKPYMFYYPNNSIMQITGDWRTKHFFDIQGLDYNLGEIERDFLLDRYEDPRIYFALSYATMGGARLRNEPYTAEKLDGQLDEQVRQYLESSQGLKIDREKNDLYLSNLFTMYKHKELFSESEFATIRRFRDRKPEERAWLNFIYDYLSEEDVKYLESTDFDIKFLKYDWELDEAP